MLNYVYETHLMADPTLPFIFHKAFAVTDTSMLYNWHENIELLWCIEGEGTLRCGAQVLPFCTGDIALINTNTPHCICSKSSIQYRCLIVANRFFQDNGIDIDSLRFQPILKDPSLYRQLEAVADAYEQQGAYRTPAIRHAVLAVVLRICNDYVAEFVEPDNTAVYIRAVLQYIRAHLVEPLTLEQIAEHVGISKYYLCRLFHKYTGTTIISVIQTMRCAEAKRLIEDGMPIGTAAMACGFDNLSYFTRTFKRIMGCIPSSLRK